MAEIRAEKTRRQIERERLTLANNSDAIRARCRTLAGFVREAWHVVEPGTTLVWNWHLDALCEHLQAISEGRLHPRLLANVPPGASKSMLVSVMWQAWEWGPGHMPHTRFLCTSYGEAPITRDARKCRDLILSEWYQTLWPEVRLVRAGETSFANSATGTREISAFGSLTSQRGDRFICLPYHTKIMTDAGMLPVGDIVCRRLAVKVAGWDGRAAVWQSINAYERNPPGEIFEIATDFGSFRCTGDHLMFIKGRGWVRADDAKIGEAALYCEDFYPMQNLRQGDRAPAEQGSPILQPRMLRDRETAPRGGRPDVPLRNMRDAHISRTGEDAGADILFSEVQREGIVRAKQPGVFWWAHNTFMRAMRRAIYQIAKGSRSKGREDLLSLMCYETPIRQKRAHGLVSALRRVWRFVFREKSWVSFLLASLRESSACEADFRGRKWALCAWEGGASVSSRLVTQLQGKNPREGREQMPGLLGAAPGKRSGAPCASHRLCEGEPKRGEPDHGLQILPRDDARKAGTAGRVVEAPIRSIARIGLTGEPTFNVNVGPCHNYFAEGHLVHNCDDPHSTETAESDTERANTTRKFREGALNRLNDQQKSALVVIMQRLHGEDISGVILSRKMDFIHLRLPMRFEADRRCETPIFTDPRTYDGELLDPVRFPAGVCDALERDMGEYAWNGQYQQRPAPRAGGMIKPDRIEIIEERPKARWVRAWDLASTKNAGDWTVGALLGKTPELRPVIGDIIRLRGGPDEVEAAIAAAAARDGRDVAISIPQDPGPGGKAWATHILRKVHGYVVEVTPEPASKAVRAQPIASQINGGNVLMVRGEWNDALTQEMRVFPLGAHDDQIDALSRGYTALTADTMGAQLFTVDSLLAHGEPIALPTHCDTIYATIASNAKTGKPGDAVSVVYWAVDKHAAPFPLLALDWDLVQIDVATNGAWLAGIYQRLEEMGVAHKPRFGSLGVFIDDSGTGAVLLQQAERYGFAHAIESRLTTMGKSERAISISGYVLGGSVKLARAAYERVSTHKQLTRNQLVGELMAFRVGAKDDAITQDTLLEAFSYGVALGVGTPAGF